MEGFIIGDRGPESFFQAQDQVWKILEERYYPSFLVVLSCQMTGRQGQHFETDSIPLESSGRERHISWKESSSADSDGVIEWSEQTQVAQSRIEQLDARLTVKIQVNVLIITMFTARTIEGHVQWNSILNIAVQQRMYTVHCT